MEAGELISPRELQKVTSTLDICFDTEAWVCDALVNMRFSREVDYVGRFVFLKDTCHCGYVADIGFFKYVVFIFSHGNVVQISSVCERVNIYKKLARIFPDRVIKIMAADKPSTTRYDRSFYK